MTQYHWGILGTGHIAHKFADGLRQLEQAKLYAVGSRRQETATAFAEEFGFAKAYPSYEALLADPAVDIVYVSSPHPWHHAHTLACLEAGKAVLCEKPLALNAAQATEMRDAARQHGCFLMEAMWTRFLPAWQQVQAWLAEGRIGELRLLTADFSFRSDLTQTADRKFDPALGGGALLDIGIYPLYLACWLFGAQPQEMQSQAHLSAQGIDLQSSYLLHYAGGRLASLTASFEVNGSKTALIHGHQGEIRVPLFWRGDEAILSVAGEEPLHVHAPYPSSGLQFQAQHLMECLDEGRLESPVMPLDESVAIHQLMDQMRASWGMQYPGEKE